MATEADEGARRAATRAEEARWGSAMAAAQSGDAGAYQKLLEELLPVVGRMVRARLFDASAVDDVTQNALLSIHRARHTYRAERPFGPWLRAVVRNAVIDWLRERRRRSGREVEVEQIELLPDPNSGAEPVSRELSPALVEALGALPDKHRQAVELLQLRGLSVAEAALRVGVSPGALKVRAHRGYRALRERLKDSGGPDT
jgi:RNA polymerase sigma factor (sigma-70 family)